MKRRFTYYVLVTCVLVIFVTCKSVGISQSTRNEILEIQMICQSYPESKLSTSLSITPDSVFLFIQSAERSDVKKDTTSIQKWNKLVRLLNVKDFNDLDSNRLDCIPLKDCSKPILKLKTKDSTYTKYDIIFSLQSIDTAKTIEDLLNKNCS